MIAKFEQVTFKYANKIVFENTSFIINDSRTGIIGKNGVGKSSLLKLIAKKETADSGNLLVNDTYRFAYLEQNFNNTDLNAFDYIKSQSKHVDDFEIKKFLNKFNINNVKYEFLSGGEKRKLDLIVVLLSNADCILLDEPTNHLDHKMIDFLINHLNKYIKNAVIISHDRYFLDKVCLNMAYIRDNKVKVVSENYTGCIKVINENVESIIATDRKVSKKLLVAQKWMDQGPKARSTKSKHLIDNYNDLKEHKYYKEEKLEEFIFDMKRLGSKTIEISNLSYGYDELLFSNFTYSFLKNDKIGIIGKNASGKSTLLKLIIGQINSPNIALGETVNIGYFSQHTDFENEKIKVIDYINDISKYIEFRKKILSSLKFLELFGFDSSHHNNYIENLSGGQKRRLSLVIMLLKKPNVLILDEPTNDFDTETLELLESLLIDFKGIVICVSHDRYFLNKITNKLFIFENKKINISYNGYEDYKVIKKEKKIKKITKQKVSNVKMSYKEKYEFEHIEQEIENIELQIKEIDEQIIKSDYQKIATLSSKRQTLQVMLHDKNKRWEYLFDLNDRIN